MDKLKVILVQDSSDKSVSSPDQPILPEGIEVVGSLVIEGFGANGGSRDGPQPVEGEVCQGVAVGEHIVGLVQTGSSREPSGRVFPLRPTDEIGERPVRLTRTELEVLRLLAKGHQNKEIAHEMYISVNTVKSHVSSILRKLRVRNRAQAVRYVYKCGMWQ